jgi:hypothetical protein
MRNVHATFQRQLLNIAQAQVEPDVKQDNMRGDLWRS